MPVLTATTILHHAPIRMRRIGAATCLSVNIPISGQAVTMVTPGCLTQCLTKPWRRPSRHSRQKWPACSGTFPQFDSRPRFSLSEACCESGRRPRFRRPDERTGQLGMTTASPLGQLDWTLALMLQKIHAARALSMVSKCFWTTGLLTTSSTCRPPCWTSNPARLINPHRKSRRRRNRPTNSKPANDVSPI